MAIRKDPDSHEVNALLALSGDLAGRRVLEIGCGDGRLLRRYAHLAGHVTGIDPDAERIAEAARLLPPALQERVALEAVEVTDFRPKHPFHTIILGWSL
jgi:cyclopropane fatty-acyl-phospholipid synthase-like methyltransferase